MAIIKLLLRLRIAGDSKPSWLPHSSKAPVARIVTHRRGNAILRLCGIIPASIAMLASSSAYADFPGGFIDPTDTAQARPVPTYSEIQQFLPARGAFTFPAPYNTVGIRITNPSDCSEPDCEVASVGYPYWRTMNDHVGSDTVSILVNWHYPADPDNPDSYYLYKHFLYSYNKTTDVVSNPALMVDENGDPLSNAITGEIWYFSASQPTKLYMNDLNPARLMRYDIVTHQSEVVFDVTSAFGSGYKIWQMHSSDDDLVHSATLRNSSNQPLGCIAYHEDTGKFQYFAATGTNFDECNLDRSGRWLMMLETTPEGGPGDDMRIFDLSTGANTITSGFQGLATSAQLISAGVERRVLDQDGAVGHADMGYGYVVGANDHDTGYYDPFTSYDFTTNPLSGVRQFHTRVGGAFVAGDISHTNARPDVPMDQQYVCGSNADTSTTIPWANEIVCFRLDGSSTTLVVAPVMTDMNSSVGGTDYGKEPKGNLDITGQYFMWTSNTGGSRVDAYLVKVPAQLLGGGGGGTDTIAPTVQITSPAENATVSGTVAISVNASDNVGVSGVQFKLDGANLGTEVTVAPYAVNWDTSTSTAGSHELTALARDAAGNTTLSDPVAVTVNSGDSTPPNISNVTVSNISTTGVTISWSTNEESDSQVKYGTTSSYGNTTDLDTTPVTQHTVTLTGLSSNVLYHYQILSRDASDNLASAPDATFTTVSSPPELQTVAWINLVNVTADGGSLQKSGGCDGCEDGTAQSQQFIDSNGGYLEYTVSSTTQVGYVGLKNGTPAQSSDQLPFSLKTVSGYAEVHELGVYHGGTTIVVGDVLRISVNSSGVVTYSKNGTVFHTSTATANFPLYANVVYSSHAASIQDAVIMGESAPSSLQTVAWTDLTNMTADGGSIQKTSGAAGGEDAYARSQQQIGPEGGYLEFTVSETTYVAYTGLKNGALAQSSTELPFSIKIVSGYAEVHEGDVYRADTTVAVGDVLRISVSPSGVVTYSKNGTVYYTSAATATFPLHANVVFFTITAAIQDAVIMGESAPSSLQTVTWTDLTNMTADGGSIQKTSGAAGGEDAYARSQQQIGPEGGYLEFTVSETTYVAYTGLKNGALAQSSTELPFSIKIVSGYAEVHEGDVYRADTTVAVGDVLRISVSPSGIVTYAKNGNVYYTSAATAIFPLHANVVFYSITAAIQDAIIYGEY